MCMSKKDKLIQQVKDDYFSNVENVNIYSHAITGEHIEVLGRFIDKTGFNYTELEDILIRGYLDKMESSK